MTARYNDWQSRLGAVLGERMAKPFAWGENDCCTFACDCVLALSGHDPAAGLRGHRTARDATETLQGIGGVQGAADARLGPRIAPLLAQVGDIGLGVLEGRETLLVCVGDAWVGPAKDGMARLPFDSVPDTAWRAF
jgi:Domain of unknown function (DUF6950)